MHTTRNKKSRARKLTEADMMSDVENLVIMLGSNLFERDESEFSNSTRRPESPSYNTLMNKESIFHSNYRENEIRDFVVNGHSSGGAKTSTEFKKISRELNQRITQEMND